MNPKVLQNRRVTKRWMVSRFSSAWAFYLLSFLDYVEVNQCSIAAGQNTTLFLAKSSDKMSELPRHPEDVEPPALCVMCETEKGDDDSPLECDKVSCFFVSLLVLFLIPIQLSPT